MTVKNITREVVALTDQPEQIHRAVLEGMGIDWELAYAHPLDHNLLHEAEKLLVTEELWDSYEIAVNDSDTDHDKTWFRHYRSAPAVVLGASLLKAIGKDKVHTIIAEKPVEAK